MALSMEEERILTEIASQLREEDPVLAGRLAGFERLRMRRRIRSIAGMAGAVLVIIALVVAAVITVPS